MKIRTKIQTYSSLFLSVMLILLSIIVLIAFLWISVERERDLLEDQASLIEENILTKDLISSDPDLMEPYIPDDGMVRIFGTDGRLVKSFTDEEDLEGLAVKAINEKGYDFTKADGEYVMTYRYPYPDEGKKLGMIEVTQPQDTLLDNLSTLALVLGGASLFVILLSILAGKWLANLILRPISIMSGTMNDIEKSGEFKRIPLADQSKDELQVMGVAFNRMIERLERNYNQQQQFLSDASHELKTPITVIESYSSLLKRWGMKDEAIQEEAVGAIHHEAVRMKKLTEHLLQSASQTEPSADVEGKIELISFCEGIAQTFRRTGNRAITIESEFKEIYAMTISSKLEQVIVILLDNAMKYSESSIQIMIKRQADEIFIGVKDHGAGISPEHLPHVFERFYRVDSSRARKTGGNGLGLSIARTLVESFEGKLEIQSEVGEGTLVTITLSHQILI
ncbi:HAMP domain-containing histidine kinase [Bacillus sp. ISL-4]|uniref:sensor histidine kinase n=1 Tax=Bacillus sp. ISL-4 TaxID=2819125 RepID=UPI001BEB6A76|nr:HAMP domain-containing sensor histidine kinase [Bacillus sp. ISL-4]MBT2666528.1 HAMP domain-containing histidine kinase [Bacillus sp. ISL-4]MBT2670914.1 HAMP domain-containing histidine kinase [Streptomyces sp. ISL-14]